jgi:hypothetical protein
MSVLYVVYICKLSLSWSMSANSWTYGGGSCLDISIGTETFEPSQAAIWHTASSFCTHRQPSHPRSVSKIIHE